MPTKKKAEAQDKERGPEVETPEAPASSESEKPKSTPKKATKKAPPKEPEPDRGPWSTFYSGVPAVANAVRVTIPHANECHPSKWFVHAGLCGIQVDALAIAWRNPATGEDVLTHVWDGDGSGTAKFVEGRGDTMMSHSEIDVR